MAKKVQEQIDELKAKWWRRAHDAELVAPEATKLLIEEQPEYWDEVTDLMLSYPEHIEDITDQCGKAYFQQCIAKSVDERERIQIMAVAGLPLIYTPRWDETTRRKQASEGKKQCSYCRREFTLEEFGRHPMLCKDCNGLTIANAEVRAKHIYKTHLKSQGLKICKSCHKEKKLSEFYTNGRSGYYKSYCKKCFNNKNKEKRAKAK